MAGRNLFAEQGRNLFAEPVEAPIPDTDPSLAEQARTPSLTERGAEIFGLDPNIVERSMLVPTGRNTQGETELAVPQVGVDLLNSLIGPGEAAKGTPITNEDALKFTLDFLVPGTSIKAPSSTLTKRQFIKGAPSVDDLRNQSRAALGQAKATGAVVGDNAFTRFVDDLGVDLAKAGASDDLHPKVTGAFRALASEGEFASRAKAAGFSGLDVDDLVTKRRQIGVALRSTEPDEARLAGIMADKFDDFVANLTPQDLIAGAGNEGTEEIAKNLAEFRRLWSRAAKADTIETAIEQARNTASGFENGMRIEFRKILNNQRKVKGFTKTEKEAMRRVVNGGPARTALRLLGKASFGTQGGTNFLGGTIGVGIGGTVGGTPGAMIAPAIGFAAQKGAQRSTQNAAELARAIAATGQAAPNVESRLLQRLLALAPPTVGALSSRPAAEGDIQIGSPTGGIQSRLLDQLLRQQQTR